MSFINNNKFFKKSIDDELTKIGYKELNNENVKNKIFFCDVDYPNRNNPSFTLCQIVNQLEDINCLGNKKTQYHNHLKYYKKRPDYLPFTVPFCRDDIDEISQLFLGNPRESPKVYIVKPENDSFRNGVGIVRNKLELMSHLDEYYMYPDWIIQDYIDDPLLINGKKFHMRIYVIYIQTKDYQMAYLSDVGFIYTANKDFERETFDNEIVLSGESTPNNVFSVPDDFYRNFGKKVWDEKVKPQIVKISRETLLAVLDKLQCKGQAEKCFKILGYDILINNDYKCYLAEINARSITYKYPNEHFLDTFYRNILKLVLAKEPLTNKELKDKNIPFERILFNKSGQVTEHFSGDRIPDMRFSLNNEKIVKSQKFNNFYLKVVLPFLVLVLILIFILVYLKH